MPTKPECKATGALGSLIVCYTKYISIFIGSFEVFKEIIITLQTLIVKPSSNEEYIMHSLLFTLFRDVC